MAVKSRRRWILLVLFLLLFGGAIAYRISLYRSVPTVVSIEDVQKQQGIPVEVFRIQRRDLEMWRVAVGTLEGEEQAEVVSQVNTHVERVACREGERVEKGQILVYLSREDPSNIIQHYHQARAAYDQAERDLGRIRTLFEKGAAAEKALDQAEAAHEVAKANLASARSGVEATSPISGTVLRVYVSPGDPVAQRMPLVRVGKVGRVKAVLDLSAKEASGVSVGSRARLRDPGDPSGYLDGTVVRRALSADAQSRLFRCEALFPNPQGRTQTGVLAEIGLLVAESAGALAVPREAVIGLGSSESPFSWVVREGLAERKEISPGLVTHEWVEILSGLGEEAWVVVRGQNLLTGGCRVRIHQRIENLPGEGERRP